LEELMARGFSVDYKLLLGWSAETELPLADILKMVYRSAPCTAEVEGVRYSRRFHNFLFGMSDLFKEADGKGLRVCAFRYIGNGKPKSLQEAIEEESFFTFGTHVASAAKEGIRLMTSKFDKPENPRYLSRYRTPSGVTVTTKRASKMGSQIASSPGCEACNGTGMVYQFDDCLLCGGAGCSQCGFSGQVKMKLPCPDCQVQQSFVDAIRRR
jgi:hypothetical protein